MASKRNADGTYAVSRVFPETPAAEAGVLAGDIIVAVDGRPARDIGTEELRRLLERDGAAVTLRLGRGPENIDVVLRLRRLV
jgi:C-terminal processing protease CtpA/Prc